MKEKSNKTNVIYSVCFLAMMMLFGITATVIVISNHLPGKINNKTDTISFLQQYPFSEDVQNDTKSTEKPGFGFVEDYQNLAKWVTDNFEENLRKIEPLSSPLKKCICTLENLLSGDVLITDSEALIKLPNGYLAECFKYCPSTEAWNSILDFSDWLKSNDIPFVSLITPDKSDDSVTVFPEGVPHGYTQMMDEYKAFMDENDIDYVETKEWLLAENDDLYSWFYRTDHHWNVHAGFVTARKTAEYLTETYSVPTDANALLDDNYELVSFPDSFLGSYGQTWTIARKEDMEVFYPTNESNYHIVIPGFIDKSGSFSDTLIDQSCLSINESSYNAFLYGARPLIFIENNTCMNGTRILIIKFSFANALCPYLADTVQYLDIIDIISPKNFDGSIRSFIEQTKPDAVLLCLGVAIEGYEDNLRLK